MTFDDREPRIVRFPPGGKMKSARIDPSKYGPTAMNVVPVECVMSRVA